MFTQMDIRLSLQDKLLLAFGLNAFIYGVILYVNLEGADRTLSAIFGHNFGVHAIDYFVGSLVVFGWIYLAEYLFKRFEVWFGEENIRKGSLIPTLLAVVMFIILNLAVNYGTVMLIYWLEISVLHRPPDNILLTDPYSLMSLRFSYAIYVIMELFVYYLLIHRRIRQRMSEAAIRAEKAKRERLETQYALLRSRVNPHFLFNSLSTLASLVHVDGDKSEQFIDKLSAAYRYMLENRESSTVLLKNELQFLQSYAFLLETRYGNKFRLENKVPSKVAARTCVVPLALQAIVDDALKTNRFSAQSPLVIVLSLETDELLLQYHSQPRTVPDRSIGDWDWRLLEQCYSLLLPDHRSVRRRTKNGLFTVRLPLIAHSVTSNHSATYG